MSGNGLSSSQLRQGTLSKIPVNRYNNGGSSSGGFNNGGFNNGGFNPSSFNGGYNGGFNNGGFNNGGFNNGGFNNGGYSPAPIFEQVGRHEVEFVPETSYVPEFVY
jgi:hypothetical protein